MAAPMQAPSRPPRIPYNVAFQQIVGMVAHTVQATGEQWSAAERQAAACTIFIQAARDGMLCRWEEPAQPENKPAVAANRTATQSADDPGPLLAESIRQARQGLIRAFHEIESELPPSVYEAVLSWNGVSCPEDFRPDQINKAAACYVSLKQARNQYRADQQTTVEHFEATEDTWR